MKLSILSTQYENDHSPYLAQKEIMQYIANHMGDFHAYGDLCSLAASSNFTLGAANQVQPPKAVGQSLQLKL